MRQSAGEAEAVSDRGAMEKRTNNDGANVIGAPPLLARARALRLSEMVLCRCRLKAPFSPRCPLYQQLLTPV